MRLSSCMKNRYTVGECVYCSAKPYPIRDVLLSEAAFLSKNRSEYFVYSVDGRPVASFGPVSGRTRWRLFSSLR